MAVLAWLRTHKIFGEGFQRLLRAEMAEYIIGLDRLASVRGRASQFQLRVIAFGERATLDGQRMWRRVRANRCERFFDVRVGDLG